MSAPVVVVNDLTVYGPRRSELALHCPQEGGDMEAAIACVVRMVRELELIAGRPLGTEIALLVAASRIEVWK
jgi:hypothetical protein